MRHGAEGRLNGGQSAWDHCSRIQTGKHEDHMSRLGVIGWSTQESQGWNDWLQTRLDRHWEH